jgi:hypothetical protein
MKLPKGAVRNNPPKMSGFVDRNKGQAIDDEFAISSQKALKPGRGPLPKGAVRNSEKPILNQFLENVGQTAINIPSSGLKYAKDMAYPVMHPQETVESLGNLASGVLHKTPFYPGVQDDEKYADAVGQHMKDRYGGIDNIGRTVRDDPVGFLGDAAGLLTLGGMAPKMAKVASVGRTIEPANLALKSAAHITGLGENIPRNLYARAAKFPTTIPIHRRNALLQQLVDDGIPLTSAGVSKNTRNVAKTERKLVGSVKKAMDQRKVYDITDPKYPQLNLLDSQTHPGIRASETFKKAEDYVRTLTPEVSANMVTSGADVKAANTTLDFLKKWRDDSGRPIMNLMDVLENKRQAHARVDWRKGSAKEKARNKIYKKIAKADKEILEAEVPGIESLNEVYGRRLEARKPLERAAERIGNTQLLSLTDLIAGSAGGLLGASSGSVDHILMGLLGGATVSQLNSPGFLTGVARTLNAIGNNRVAKRMRSAPWDSGALPGVGVHALVQSGRLASEE